MRHRNRITLLSLAAAGTVLLSGISSAQEEFMFSVDASSLDTPREVSIVYDRLVRDATEYCNELDTIQHVNPAEINLCVSDVVSTVVDEIDAPLLTSYHLTRSRSGNRIYTASL